MANRQFSIPISSTPGGSSSVPLDSPSFTGTPTAPTAAAGNSTTQIATTAFVFGAAGIAPKLVQSGLIAQYNMTDGSGSVLTDSSGNANNGALAAGAAAPTWLANGGLSFSAASQQFVTLPVALNTAKTWMFVTYFDPTASGVADRCVVIAPNTNNVVTGAGPSMFYSAALSGYSNSSSISGLVWGQRGWNQSAVIASGTMMPVHGYQIFTISQTAGGDTIYQYNQSTVTANTVGSLSAGNLQLGGGFASAGHFYQGQILFAAFWSGALTAPQVLQNVAAVQQLLASRGLVLNGVPGGGTWQTPNSADTIILSGDSETTFLANPNLPTSPVTNIFVSGWPGQSAEFVSSQAAVTVDSLYPNTGTSLTTAGLGANKAGVIVNLGTNATTPTADLNTIAQYCRNRKKMGWRVFVTSIMSNQSGGNHDSNKNSLNPPLRQYWKDWADGFLNIAASPVLGANGAFSNTAYSATGIHWDTTLSKQIAGRLYSWAIRRMYGNTVYGSPNVASTSPYLCQPEDIFWIANDASSISAYLLSAQNFTGQTVTVKNSGAGALTLNPKPVSATITNLSLTSNVVTLAAANNYIAGDVVVLNGLTTNPTLNGISGIINSSGLSASGFQFNYTHGNIGSASETGFATDACYCQIAVITNISETAGNVVSVTASNNYSAGQSVAFSGLTTATWLNGHSANVSGTGLSSSGFQVTDPTSHGAQSSAAETGIAIYNYPADTIEGSSSVSVSPGATCVLLSQFAADSTGLANWITLQNS